jgi:hypothetical protein
MPDICGVCGTTKENPENAYCENGHDYLDFSNPELANYLVRWVEPAAKNLSMSLSELEGKAKK